MKYRALLIALMTAGLVTACGETEAPKAPGDKTAVDTAVEKVSEGAEQMKDAAVAKAKELIAQAEQYISEGKADLAAKIVEKLDAFDEGTLPEAVQSQVDRIKEMLASNTPDMETTGAGASADAAPADAAAGTMAPPAPAEAGGMGGH